MGNVTIGPAGDQDQQWCARLMAASDPWRTLGRGHEDCLARVEHPEYTLLLARREGRPLGFVLLHPRGVAGSPYIAAIAVDEDARGQGIGRLLLERAENWWPEARHIFLCVSSFNDGARLLYQRCGYQVVGELIDYVIEGASEILMHKRLAGR